MERRFLDAPDIKVEVREGKMPLIHGYAATYYSEQDPGTEFELWPGAKERIMPGAFDRALAENQDVAALFNHDTGVVLGRTPNTLRLETDSRGLRYTIEPPDTQAARDLITSIQRGDVRGSSFSFRVPDGGQSWARNSDGTRVRELRSVNLSDVGPVTSPAYKSTSAGVRSEDVAEARCACEVVEQAEAAAEKEAEPVTEPAAEPAIARSVVMTKATLAELGL